MSSQPAQPPMVKSQVMSSKLVSSRSFDRDRFVSLFKGNSTGGIFSVNTAAHILLPAVIGSVLALMLNYIGFKDAEGNPMIQLPVSETVSASEDDAQSAGEATSPQIYLHYLIYASASVIASSLLTLGSVGLPTEEKDRLRAWTVASVGALTLPLTVGSLTGLSQAVERAETEAQEAQEQLEVQAKKNEEFTDEYFEAVKNPNDPTQIFKPLGVVIEQAQEVSQKADESSAQVLEESLKKLKEVEEIVEKNNIQETDVDVSQDDLKTQDLDQLIDGIKDDLKDGIQQKEESKDPADSSRQDS